MIFEPRIVSGERRIDTIFWPKMFRIILTSPFGEAPLIQNIFDLKI